MLSRRRFLSMAAGGAALSSCRGRLPPELEQDLPPPLLVPSESVTREPRRSQRIHPEVIVDIDVNDEVWLRPAALTLEDIDELVGDLFD